MTAQKIFYILGSAILLLLLVWQLSEATTPYPPEIQKRINGASAPMVCEKETPRKVSTISYRKYDEKWLIRIFTKDGEELEIWLNESMPKNRIAFYLALARHDKAYYHVDGQWLDQDAITEEEAKQLDRRIKFTGEEKRFFHECFIEKMRTAP